MSALTTSYCGGIGGPDDNAAQAGYVIAQSVTGDVTHTLTGEGHDASEDGSGRGTPIVVQPLAVRGRDGGAQLEVGPAGGPANTLRAGDGGSSRQSLIQITYGGNGNGPTTQNGPDQALRAVRLADEPEASAQRRPRGDLPLPAPEVLRPEVYGSSVRCAADNGHAELGNGSLPRAQDGSSGSVREMREAERPGRASHQRELARQPAGEPNSTLPVMSPEDSHIQVIVRRLTELECERLMGYPDEWTDGQYGSARYRQLGNSVAVPAVASVARRIVAVDAAIAGGALS